MTKSWGILGNPTKEEMQRYMDMPVGKFKQYVAAISKKNKGKVLNTYTVRIYESRADVYRAFVKVRAWDRDEAINVAMRMPKKSFEWENSPMSRDKYSYEYVISQVD